MMEGLGILIKCKFVKEASECRLPSLLSLSKCLHENISKETLPIELGLREEACVVLHKKGGFVSY